MAVILILIFIFLVGVFIGGVSAFIVAGSFTSWHTKKRSG